MEVLVVVGAGLDVHKKTVVACCVDGRSSPPTLSRKTFRTFRSDLEQLRDWLLARGCTHVAMESTGVYWVPVYRVLEGHFRSCWAMPVTWPMYREERPIRAMRSGSANFSGTV